MVKYPPGEKVVHWSAIYIGSMTALITAIWLINEGLGSSTTVDSLIVGGILLMLIGTAAAHWLPGVGGLLILLGCLGISGTPNDVIPAVSVAVGLLLLLDTAIRAGSERRQAS